MRINRGLVIPWDAADRITVANLKEQLSYLESELEGHDKGEHYLHPEDVENSRTKYIPAIKLIIDYYSGPYDDE